MKLHPDERRRRENVYRLHWDEAHRPENRLRMKNYRDRCRAAGLCQRCRKRPVFSPISYSECVECREYQRERRAGK